MSYTSPLSYKTSLSSKTDRGKFTDGKSGSFFWITSDKKLVVKTISKAEFRLMNDILPQYYEVNLPSKLIFFTLLKSAVHL